MRPFPASHPLIITAALNGAEVTREQQPALPITSEELARAGIEAVQAGASILHLHARKPDGTPSHDPALFDEAIRLIQAECDPIIQISTGGSIGMTAEERLAPLVLRPEMASLTTGTVNFGDGVFHNPPDLVETFARRMTELGIKPEIEVFDTGMLTTALQLVRRGLLQPPLHVQFVLGVPGAMAGTPRNLFHLLESLPPEYTWTVAGIGRVQLPLTALAISLGGHVRVGFEDNIYYRKGELAQSNAQLVARVARLAAELERPVATPAEARALLGLPPREGGNPPQ